MSAVTGFCNFYARVPVKDDGSREPINLKKPVVVSSDMVLPNKRTPGAIKRPHLIGIAGKGFLDFPIRVHPEMWADPSWGYVTLSGRAEIGRVDRKGSRSIRLDDLPKIDVLYMRSVHRELRDRIHAFVLERRDLFGDKVFGAGDEDDEYRFDEQDRRWMGQFLAAKPWRAILLLEMPELAHLKGICLEGLARAGQMYNMIILFPGAKIRDTQVRPLYMGKHVCFPDFIEVEESS